MNETDPAPEIIEVAELPGGQVVQHRDLVVFAQGLGQMRADEARSPGDQVTNHAAMRGVVVRRVVCDMGRIRLSEQLCPQGPAASSLEDGL